MKEYIQKKSFVEKILSAAKLDELNIIILFARYIEKILMRNGLVLTKTARHIGRERMISLEERGWEYIRYSTLELSAHEIIDNKIEGNVAELGVYKGTFASKINQLFPDRKLYLFDTFEGFDNVDVDKEKKIGEYTHRDFSDTSVLNVLDRMKYKDKCIIKKGFFPDTAKDIDDIFCFVSLDVDLYQPSYEGLKFFYPRLSRGGYIFVHDFNNSNYKGVRKAVQKFCAEEKIPYIPMTDTTGTVVIAK